MSLICLIHITADLPADPTVLILHASSLLKMYSELQNLPGLLPPHLHSASLLQMCSVTQSLHSAGELFPPLSLKLCFCSSSPLISDQIGSALLPLLSSVCEFVCNWVVVCGSVAFSPPVHAGLFVYGACLYGASVFYTNQS